MSNPSAVEDLLIAALEKGTPQERADFLEQACRGDPELCRRVERLLQAYPQAGSFLEKPAVEIQRTVDPVPGEAIGSRIGPYKLLQKIGEGGMGTVYVAEQEQPVKRRVALKVIKPGMDSAQVIARFEAERQALALMDHTNIAKVFDAGTTGAGLPYFVMELVHGVPITRYCDELHLTLRGRLELFVPVCQAVQHAHQKGIIHRDLKPSNVLVCMQDGKPVPKIIDFGVAKATGQGLTERTLVTEFGAVVGTLEYMSPEQAEMSPLGVDTRSDVYGLGVLLYELLTGTTPLDRRRLKEAAYTELLRVIREEEPPPPSTRLTQSKESLATLAALRRTEPAKLPRLVRGELDWIVMKCLEKDRTRRYETANGLARDLQCHLADEPVEACPPRAGYRLGKLARKHRTAVVCTLAIIIACLVAAVGQTINIIHARRAEAEARFQRDRAVEAEAVAAEARDRAVAAEIQALAEKQRADKEAAAAQAVLGFLQERVLAAAQPKGQEGGLGKDATIRAALDAAEPGIDQAFARQPAVEAAIRRSVGDVYRALGQYAEAQKHLERSVALRAAQLGADHPDTLASKNSLALLYWAQGKYHQAEALLNEVLQARKTQRGTDHADTLTSKNNLALLYKQQGKYAHAEPLFMEVLEARRHQLGPDHPETLDTMSNLAALYHQRGRYDEAEHLYKQVLAGYHRQLGADHPHTLTCLNSLADLYRVRGRYDEAEPLFKQVLEARRRTLGADHPHTLTSMNNLAGLYKARGRYDEAEPLFKQVLEARRRTLGPEHPDALTSLSDLGGLYQARGRYDQAEPLFQQVLVAQRRTLGPEHPDTLKSMNNLAALYGSQKKLDRSIPLFEECLKLQRTKLGTDHPETLLTLANLGVNYRDAGRLEAGLRCLEEAVATARRRFGSLPADLAWIPGALATTYDRLNQFAKSELLHRDVLGQARQQFGPNDPRTLEALARLGWNLLHQKKFMEAEPLLRECLALREKKQPEEWSTFDTKSMLGGALLGQQKYAGAEPLLLQGYEGMKQREAKIPADGRGGLSEALERLVQLYEAWGKKDEAAKWRKELEAMKVPSKRGAAKP
jgi:serine/threonine protein kinase/tetratricopeptide (TPR) repeat protein